MYKNTIEQPGEFLRDGLDLASRDELYQLARSHGVTEIDEAMYMAGNAGEKMKRILRARGLSIKPKMQIFDTPAEQSIKTTSFDDFVSEPTAPLNRTLDHRVMSRAEMAKECKRRGIKMQRTDTKEKLQERLSESHAA